MKNRGVAKQKMEEFVIGLARRELEDFVTVTDARSNTGIFAVVIILLMGKTQ